jgi:murein DD-endopeptidase MepM/ murein hydrolase activator NlpD
MPNPVANLDKYGLSAGEWYRTSGLYHGAWDIPCPTHTALFAVMGGRVIGRNSGVPVNRTGGSGSPSNWILIYTPPFPGFPHGATTYYQHLATVNRSVKVGAVVTPGQRIGSTDNTGNSSGPHLHLHVMYGKQSRYALYSNHQLAVYPPNKAWKAYDKYKSAAPQVSIKRNLKERPLLPGESSSAIKKLKKLLGSRNTSTTYGRLLKRRVKKIQKEYGLREKNGVIGPQTWNKIKQLKK